MYTMQRHDSAAKALHVIQSDTPDKRAAYIQSFHSGSKNDYVRYATTVLSAFQRDQQKKLTQRNCTKNLIMLLAVPVLSNCRCLG